MNNEEIQIDALTNILLAIDLLEPNLVAQEMYRSLYRTTLTMINNPNIYGDVRDIVYEIHNLLTVNKGFIITVEPDIDYAEYAYKLCEYLPV